MISTPKWCNFSSKKSKCITRFIHYLLEFVGEYVLNSGHSSLADAGFADAWCTFGVELLATDEFDSIVGEFLLLELEETFCKVGELVDEEHWFELEDNWTEGGDGVGFLFENELKTNVTELSATCISFTLHVVWLTWSVVTVVIVAECYWSVVRVISFRILGVCLAAFLLS